MRQPHAPLALVDAEPLEPALDIVRESCSVPPGIVEDDHPDAARLAIPHGREPNVRRAASRSPQRTDDRIELRRRAMPEERERDVQVVARENANLVQFSTLPALELLESVVGQAQGEKEPQPFIAAHARGGRWTAPSRLRAEFQELPEQMERGDSCPCPHLRALPGNVERAGA